MPGRRVLSIGQCFADHAALSQTLEKHFGAEVIAAGSAEEALARLREEPVSLVLVNRILDADGSSGMALVQALRADDRLRELPVMLVSNYDDAQEQAVAAGAVTGFGKASLGQPHMLGRVRPYLE